MSKYSSVCVSTNNQVFTSQDFIEHVAAAIRTEGFESLADEFVEGIGQFKKAEEVVKFADQYVVFTDPDDLYVFDGLKSMAEHLAGDNPLQSITLARKTPKATEVRWLHNQVKRGDLTHIKLTVAGEADDLVKIRALAAIGTGMQHHYADAMKVIVDTMNVQIARGAAKFLSSIFFKEDGCDKLPDELFSRLREKLLSYDEETTLFVLEYHPFLIKHVEQTTERCLAAVKGRGDILCFIENQTPELALAAVKEDPCAIEHVIDVTKQIALISCQGEGDNLKHVPTHVQDEEIIMAAVKNNGRALKFAAFQTEEICLQSINDENEHSYGWSIEDVKDQTPKLCWAALKRNHITFRSIRELTPEMCEYVADKMPQFGQLKELPFFSLDMFQKCFACYHLSEKTKKNLEEVFDLTKLTVEMAIYYLEQGYPPSGIRLEENRDMLLAVLKEKGALLGCKFRKRDLKMCTVAVMSDPSAIQHVPKKFH